jgi:hypothetical protein
VTVMHYPEKKQEAAYLDCARKLNKAGKHTWAVFFDLDEFLILKKHAHIVTHEFRTYTHLKINHIL